MHASGPLSFTTTQTLIHALITSRLDYCNSIQYGSPNTVLNKLQYVHNSATRLLTATRRYEHITPVLLNLHWLPVKHRINFKILLATFKALNNLALSYLSDLLPLHAPNRCLRSAGANTVKTIRTKHRTWGDRAFSAAAPSLWNDLPPSPYPSGSQYSTIQTIPQNSPFRLHLNIPCSLHY